MIFYKVVVLNTVGELRSAMTILADAKITYVPNEWVYPKLPKSRLFVFKFLSDAKLFGYYLIGRQVWECEALNAELLINPYTPRPDVLYYDILINFWNRFENSYESQDGNMPNICPPDVFICDAIKLTRRIESE